MKNLRPTLFAYSFARNQLGELSHILRISQNLRVRRTDRETGEADPGHESAKRRSRGNAFSSLQPSFPRSRQLSRFNNTAS